MPRVQLPILLPRLAAQRYSCHGCGNCCRDFTVQLRDDDLRVLRDQRWEQRLGEAVTVEFRGVTYLRQRDDGACIFLEPDGRCRIHAEFGLEAKPIACQLFPFSFAPGPDGVAIGLNFACQSVLENKGAALSTHAADLRRMLASVPEAATRGAAPMLTRSLRAERAEVDAVTNVLDGWLARPDLALDVRLDGLAWLVASLAAARLEKVRGERFVELLATLVSALPGELDHVAVVEPPRGAWRMLRQAVFARIEDVTIGEAARRGRFRSVLSQLLRSRRFAAGRGAAPIRMHGWSASIAFEAVMRVEPVRDATELAAIDDLLTRWLRATILGGRAWGGGHYGWAIVDGLQALVLNLLATLWLARAHAAGAGRDALALDDVRAALGRVDRHAGRAPWLGSAGERARIGYLQATDAWRGLMAALLASARR
ncbi:MAG: YkgJ family cysteine cluster protein [Phycisphaerales bacterium]